MSSKGLDLREFVKSALLDVHGGIVDPQQDKDGVRFIAPVGIGHVNFPDDGGVVHSERLLVTTMKFDVAVSAETKSETEGGAKVGISVLSANIAGNDTTRKENVSRIQFAVPLKFPRNKKSDAGDD